MLKIVILERKNLRTYLQSPKTIKRLIEICISIKADQIAIIIIITMAIIIIS